MDIKKKYERRWEKWEELTITLVHSFIILNEAGGVRIWSISKALAT